MGLGEFLFRIRNDTAQFGSSLNQMAGKVNLFGGTVRSAFTQYILPYFGARALARYATGTMSWADSLTDLSNTTGVSIKRLQEIDYALKMTRGSLTDFETAVRMLSVSQANALGGAKDIAASYEALGFSLEELATLGAEPMLDRIFKWMEGRTLTNRNRDDLQNVLGRSATNIIPAMIEGMDAFARAAHEAGNVIETDIVLQLAAANDQWTKLKGQAKSIGVKPLANSLWFLHMVGQGAMRVWDEIREETGFLDQGEAKRRAKARAEAAVGIWEPDLAASGRVRRPPTPTAFTTPTLAGGGSGLSAMSDQWARLGLYASSGQQVYQRQIISIIRTIERETKKIAAEAKQTSENTEDW